MNCAWIKLWIKQVILEVFRWACWKKLYAVRGKKFAFLQSHDLASSKYSPEPPSRVLIWNIGHTTVTSAGRGQSRYRRLFSGMLRKIVRNEGTSRSQVVNPSLNNFGNVRVTAPCQAMLRITALSYEYWTWSKLSELFSRKICGYLPVVPTDSACFLWKPHQRRIPALGYQLNCGFFPPMKLSLNNLNCVISSHLLKNVRHFLKRILQFQTVCRFPEIKEDFCWRKSVPTLNPTNACITQPEFFGQNFPVVLVWRI